MVEGGRWEEAALVMDWERTVSTGGGGRSCGWGGGWGGEWGRVKEGKKREQIASTCSKGYE